MNQQANLDPAPVAQTSNQTSPPAAAGALDAEKRRKILALVANGSSRRVAARIVGCAASTITRTAARDPQFAEELARAEGNLEIEVLRSIRNAAKTDRYWRAGAWLLERRNPEDFAPRRAGRYTAAEVLQMLAAALATLGPTITDAQRDQVVSHLGTLLLEFEPELPPVNPAPDAAP